MLASARARTRKFYKFRKNFDELTFAIRYNSTAKYIIHPVIDNDHFYELGAR